MLNLLRKFLRPTLREQREDGVREALRRYTDRRSAPDLRVFVSSDLLPPDVDPELWAADETGHLRAFATQWAQDNGIFRAGLRVEVVLLDTKREFAFVKPLGVDPPPASAEASRPLVEPAAGEPGPAYGGAGHGHGPGQADRAILEFAGEGAQRPPLEIPGEVVVGRRSAEGVHGLDDRYMSGRHARMQYEGGRLWITDLDSKNRTYVNDVPLAPHQSRQLAVGDTVRMGTSLLRVRELHRGER
jgi:hypothetical protein